MTDPTQFSRTETLRNGLVVTIRAVRADDRARIVRAFRLLDRASVYTRFFAFKSELTPDELDRVTAPNSPGEVGLVVTTGAADNEAVIASGRYVAGPMDTGSPVAEIAFVVEEDYQGLGIAGRLLAHLAAIARANGIAALAADVLAGNQAMLAVFARSGLPMKTRQDGGTVHVLLALRPEEEPATRR